MRRKFRDDSGSVTIEATISLSAFMFAIVTILTIVNICIVQAKVGMAINSTAKELSHYSYLYSLTGLPEGQAKIASKADKHKEDFNGVIGDVSTVFNEIQNLGKKVEDQKESPDITGMLSDLKGSYDNVATASGSLKTQLENLAKDPKNVAMGIARIAATDGWNLAMSRLIAAPISKGLCKKNLVAEEGGDVEAYLKHLGVVPAANGSYLDGLNFSKSSMFPSGSNEIRVNVSYDVKVIALLPIDTTFHFNQTAVTHGWLLGEESYRTTADALNTETNSTIWTDGTIEERSSLMRNQGIKEYEKDGYARVASGEKGETFSDVHVYSEKNNQFVAIHSTNPLYSSEGEPTLTLDDINTTVVKNQIESWCNGLADSTKDRTSITTKTTGSDGTVTKKTSDCTGSTRKLVIVIPQDEGLETKMQSIVDTCNTRGVEVELVPAYGNGARTTTTAASSGEDKGGEGE